jgi:hypothetical protein
MMSLRLTPLLRGAAPARLYSAGAKLPAAPAPGATGSRDVIREQQERCSVPLAADQISDAPRE